MKYNVCNICGNTFPCSMVENGKKLSLYKRKNCLICVPLNGRPPYYGSKKYSREDFEKAVRSSTSVRQVLTTLGLGAANGGSYYSFKRMCKKWDVSTQHFTGQLWSKGKRLPSKHPTDYYLCEDCPTIITSHSLKLRLIDDGFFTRQCSICLLTEWQGQPIPIELDHINGQHEDNRLENLRILCPNCHAQTSTHAGKNIGKS